MKAPSEKHLEDWIVANPLLFGDLWIDDKDLDAPAYYHRPDGIHFIWPAFERVLKRQPQFPFGRADLIVQADLSVCVIELKQGAIDSSAVAQCIRYMDALCSIRTSTEILRSDEIDLLNHGYTREGGVHGSPTVTGIVVGHSIKDDNLRIVAKACDIQLCTYDYDPETNIYTFERHPFYDTEQTVIEYLDWASGVLGDAFITVQNGGS